MTKTPPSGVTHNKARGRGERGAAAIEFALVLPVLVLLMFGIIEFGRGYNAKVELTGAVREGARVAALSSGDPVAATVAAAPALDPDALTVVSSAGATCTTGEPVTVTATYPFTYNIPLFGDATVTLTSKAVMRCDG